MHHNDYFEVMYAVIARVLFSSCWDILWCIKTNLVWRCQMQWLQEYSFSSCLDILWCIKTIFFEVLYAMITRMLFSTCWKLRWWIKTNLVWRWQMQWLQEYYFLYVGTLCDASKRIVFWSIICRDCKNTVFHIFGIGPSLMNQN